MAQLKLAHTLRLPAPIPEWPWQAMMIAVVNCYMLWALTWVQFVVNLAFFSYQGRNLWFYTTRTDLFGLTLPQLFLVLSVSLSIFAILAVSFCTWKTPRVWKRIGMVGIFSTIAIGGSFGSIHLRHYCYESALVGREQAIEAYQQLEMTEQDDDWREYQKEQAEAYSDDIRRYESMYDIKR